MASTTSGCGIAPHDRRARLLVLIPEGARLRAELLIKLLEDPPAVAGLSADQRTALQELLDQLG